MLTVLLGSYVTTLGNVSKTSNASVTASVLATKSVRGINVSLVRSVRQTKIVPMDSNVSRRDAYKRLSVESMGTAHLDSPVRIMGVSRFPNVE